MKWLYLRLLWEMRAEDFCLKCLQKVLVYVIMVTKKGGWKMETNKSSKKSKKTAQNRKPIIVLDKNNKVQMAKPLYLQLTAPTANMSLTELKLIDVYLAAINSHKPENRVVVLEKGALENLFGVKRIQKEMLDNCFNKLLQAVVVLSSEDSDGDNTTIDKSSFVLFSRATLTQDAQDGLWKVTMECGEQAAQLIFNIDKIGYLQHPLASTAKLKSRSSYVVLKFIESRRNNKGKYPQEFEISFDELREQLCDSKYSDWRDFRRAVLLTAQNEIHEKTNTRFDFEPIRVGRKIKTVKFIIYARASDGADASRVEAPISAIDVESAVKVIDQEQAREENPLPEVIVEAIEGGSHFFYNNSHDAYLDEMGINDGEVFTGEQYDKNLPIAFLAAACRNEFLPSKMEFAVHFVNGFTKDENEQFDLLAEAYGLLNKSGVTDAKERFNCYRTLLANVCEKLMKKDGLYDRAYGLDSPEAFFGAACGNEFSVGEMTFLLRFIGRHLSDDLMTYNYIKDVYIRLNAADNGHIENRFNYFRTMVANDEELLIQMENSEHRM